MTRTRVPLRGTAVVILICLLGIGMAPRAPAADMIVERDVAVPMSDGSVLRANVFRPAEEGPFPVLVMRTPYGKPEKIDKRLVNAGFIVVAQDARGRYASDGGFESMLRTETHDASDDHCNGAIDLHLTIAAKGSVSGEAARSAFCDPVRFGRDAAGGLADSRTANRRC